MLFCEGNIIDDIARKVRGSTLLGELDWQHCEESQRGTNCNTGDEGGTKLAALLERLKWKRGAEGEGR